MYTIYGALKISQLIQELEHMKNLHGDVRVILSGSDYPEGCSGVKHVTKEAANGYYPANTVKIY